MTEGAVERWFGADFARLDPLLQKLHREGGRLRGIVRIEYGSGLAGWLGRRTAARLGIPASAAQVPLEVRIHSDRDALYWDRIFDGRSEMRSVFRAVGTWPDGHWVEDTGAVVLILQVDIADGGWRWLPVHTKLHGLSLPRWLLPRVDAGKQVVDGRYRFHVAISLPWLGWLFAYSGVLVAMD